MPFYAEQRGRESPANAARLKRPDGCKPAEIYILRKGRKRKCQNIVTVRFGRRLILRQCPTMPFGITTSP